MKGNRKDTSSGQFAARLGQLYGQEDEHSDFIRCIPDFFDDRLTLSELEDFLSHYDTCDACRDEVTIQFLIREGLSRLESGRPFHLQRELDEFVGQERRHLLHRRRLSRAAFTTEFLTIAAFAAAAVFYCMNFM